MEITEIRIKLMEGSEDRLRAFCSITIDNAFVVRDLKIIDGTSGPFVAMPSRKLSGHCNRCNYKNHLRASYCNQCGTKIQNDSHDNHDQPQKLYADVAHPINSECRELIQNAVITEFEAELSRCQQPGYRSRYDDDFADVDSDAPQAIIDSPKPQHKPAPPRPHFIDPPSGGRESASVDSNDDDSFGAGIFSG
ncbi:SpoVG family protein [Rubripirellula reticaptiva]|uniref:Putative septation protein SpoVG n=1 Tax=Rubripirellula reticaptiva TaxID=2528013 RepID=A0A5C6EUX3_9BACT|nr:SpoVG family protein [Rubripirellula reticaptiva]TWU51101.1 putative septation protein SpoVG [Rubripirellula reticaptiva]